MRKDVLEGLINRELLYQESKKRGIRADSVKVNEQMESVKKRFPDEKGFENALASSGLNSGSFRSLIEREMAIQQLVEREIVQKVTVTDQETKTYYDGHPEAFKQPAQVKASHILIKVDPQAGEPQKAEAKKKILGIRKKLQAGGDFAALAKEHSDCPSRANGGDLGYFGRGQMVPPFDAAAFALKPGELSDVVETQFGFHLIKVTDTKPEGAMPYQDVKDRLQQHLKQEKVQKDLMAYMDGLKGKAKIERLLKDKAQ
jgi:peptidyl-prolyl cis-trans isomerase C